MTSKAYSWSYNDVADFLRENDFNFVAGADSSNGAWVKLKNNGEPGVMFELKFRPDHYSKKQISRIMRLSNIHESKWTEWFDPHLDESAP